MNEWLSWGIHMFSHYICPSKEFLLIQWGKAQKDLKDQTCFHPDLCKRISPFIHLCSQIECQHLAWDFLFPSPYPAPWWAAQECLSWWPGSRVGGPDRHGGAEDRGPDATCVHVVCSSLRGHRSFPEETKEIELRHLYLTLASQSPSPPPNIHRLFWALGQQVWFLNNMKTSERKLAESESLLYPCQVRKTTGIPYLCYIMFKLRY